MKCLAIVAIIILHVSAPLLYQMEIIGYYRWVIANIIDSACRWGVLIFLMLSGIFLLKQNHGESLWQYFAKRSKRIILPFVFWGIVYLIWSKQIISCPQNVIEWKNIFYVVVYGNIYYHFWFLYVLTAFYLLVPLLREWLPQTKKNKILLMIGWWILFYLIIWIFDIGPRFRVVIDYELIIHIMGYVGIAILGYVINTIKIIKNYSSMVVIILFGFMATLVGTNIVNKEVGQHFNEWFYWYLSPNVILMAGGVFLLIKKMFSNKDIKNNNIRKLIHNFSRFSLGIYLSHILVIELIMIILARQGIIFNIMSPFISIPLVSLIVVFVSYAIMYFVDRLPIIRRIIF